MTHDELLIEINRRLDVALYNGDAQSIHALRAVVELHKPERLEFVNLIVCKQCAYVSGEGYDYDIYFRAYPCSTIQAIEKELL